MREAEYYTNRKNYSSAQSYQRRAKDAIDKADSYRRKARDARDKAQSYLMKAYNALGNVR